MRRLRTVTPCSRARSASTTDWRTRCGYPAGPSAPVVVVSPRRRLVQGEPPRLCPGGARRRCSPRSRSTSAVTATATAPMDGRALDDVARDRRAAARRARRPEAPLALRGSSMGGYLALVAAGPVGAARGRRDLPRERRGPAPRPRPRAGSRSTPTPALDAFLARTTTSTRSPALEAPVLLLHAEGDEQVPVEHSRELAALPGEPAAA